MDETEPNETDVSKDPDQESRSQALTPKDRSSQRALPSVYIDTWSTLTWKNHIRVVLGEEFSSGDDFWRFAFTMDLDEAEEFAIFLFSSIQKRRKKQAARDAASKAAEAIIAANPLIAPPKRPE